MALLWSVFKASEPAPAEKGSDPASPGEHPPAEAEPSPRCTGYSKAARGWTCLSKAATQQHGGELAAFWVDSLNPKPDTMRRITVVPEEREPLSWREVGE